MRAPPPGICRSSDPGLRIVILGLSITSSWGNGHATTYRGLVRELCRRGHQVLFLERDVPWYAAHRDLPKPPYGRTELYADLESLERRFRADVQEAHLVIVGSFVPDGILVGDWVTRTAGGISAFYDIDTPVTLAKLAKGAADYLSAELVRRYDLYLSFSGGPVLERLERDYGAPLARPLYCSVDPALYYPETYPETHEHRWDLGYMGTYSDDRQPPLERLLLEPARRSFGSNGGGRFVVAGPLYPATIDWPENVERLEHLPPAEHRAFYNAQRFTLNVTRADMVRVGYSPSVRLFEAAACGVPIISDLWEGLGAFFELGEEILVAESPEDSLRHLELAEGERRAVGERARARVLAEHTAAHRAAELEGYVLERLVLERLGRG
ncbi:MAG: glycosyltransferase [Deinococcota bacterium]|nr:glycosyltransferase [Deinococcota bacterium]